MQVGPVEHRLAGKLPAVVGAHDGGLPSLRADLVEDDIFTQEGLGDLSHLVKQNVDGIEEKIVASGADVIGGASFVVIDASIGRRDLCARASMLAKLDYRMFDNRDNAYYYDQLALVEVVMINARLRESEMKFPTWDYSGGKVVWSHWQHGFRTLVNEPVEDPYQ